MLRKLIVIGMALAISLGATAPAFASSGDSGIVGAVYLMSNAPAGNQVLVYNRAGNGLLTYSGAFATGGLGSGLGVTVPPDPLGSQNSIIVTPDGQQVFAVNAGSNEISSFMVVPGGLRLADKVTSGGAYPVSLTYRDGILYVLNAAGDGSIVGFRVADNGHLAQLQGSARSLHAATPADGAQPNILEAPAQVRFTPNGDFLVITDKGGVSGVGRILVFKLSANLPSASAAITQTAGPVPFDLTFDRFGHPVVVDAGVGSVTAYAIGDGGSLSVLSTAHTNQAATCWVTSNGRYIFTDNTGSGSLSSFATSPKGILTPVTPSSVVATTGAGTLPLDIGISRDGQFIYSLETGAGKIGVFQANPDGTLISLGTAGSFPAVSGFQGIAVY